MTVFFFFAPCLALLSLFAAIPAKCLCGMTVHVRLWDTINFLILSSMMRYFVKFRDGLVEGHYTVTYKNARFGSLSILVAARSNSVWK